MNAYKKSLLQKKWMKIKYLVVAIGGAIIKK
jgi:hypothetical protein